VVLFYPGFNCDFLITSQEKGWKSVSEMVYLVDGGTLNRGIYNSWKSLKSSGI